MKKTLFVLVLLSSLFGLTVYQLLTSPLVSRLINLQQIFVPDETEIVFAAETKQIPTGIQFPSINTGTIPVSAAIISDGKWQVFDDKAAWLSTSAIPGEGNVIIYAHNTKHLFGELDRLQSGDEITVHQNDKETRFIVQDIKTVEEDDIEAISSNENQLTLYTCEGWFDQKRLVVYAKTQ